MSILDNILNRKLKKELLSFNSVLIFGDKRSGKSSLLATGASLALKEGRPVFSNYPIKNCFQVPLLTKIAKNGVITQDTDKEWLYTTEFPRGSLIILDEISTMYPARRFKDWTEADSKFFNYLGHDGIYLLLASQYYDQVDLNVKRSCDASMFVHQRSFLRNSSYIEVSKTTTMKVADSSTEILGKDFKKGGRLVSYQVGEIPLYNLNFYRKPYYNDFDTHYQPYRKIERNFDSWNDFV